MDYIKSLVGGKPAQAPVQVEDDFADFAAAPAPAPSPVSIPAAPADAQAAVPTGVTGARPVVYTKWYRVWERTTLADFQTEMILIPFIVVALLVHFWGTRRNRRKARKWMAATAPILESEFALVGFHNTPKATPFPEGIQSEGLIQASAKLNGDNLPDDLLKEKTACEFETYATGRQNVAFVDIKVLLWKWYNPLLLGAEQIVGMFFETMKPQPEHVEAVIYSFDGNEKNFVAPPIPGVEEINKPKPIKDSTYDQFIFAIVNKLAMRKLREERYDLSLTFTKDNAKLPNWVTVMSESAEITDTLLTKDLIAAVETAGDLFEYLIISDQPIEKPTTLDEAKPKKRLHICLRLPSEREYEKVLTIFQVFLRLPDHLAASAHFRPEVMRKIKTLRETESKKLKKVADQEAEEERLRQLEKMKKDERDRKMKGMSAEEQRKFLEKENERTRKRQEKKMTKKG